MTETCCMITMTDHEDAMIGHVGAPVYSCELKLVDVPEMGYTNADQPHPRGEICVRGPTVFQGYYRDEAQTRDCLDADGWFHTGDVGSWIEGGRSIEELCAHPDVSAAVFESMQREGKSSKLR